ncbi:hypothetical protein Sjap_011755 [Stephania japonica]|uniref:Uncharacterized protein n=1 Tax=Stephania japonica TaxID=461633 RepID=A0AAP0JE08_9MAGN
MFGRDWSIKARIESRFIPILRPGPYGLDDVSGLAARYTVGIDGFTPGMGIRGFSSPLEHSSSVRRDVPLEINRTIPDTVDERSISLRNVDGMLGEESNMLYVDGLPHDCLRREAALISHDDGDHILKLSVLPDPSIVLNDKNENSMDLIVSDADVVSKSYMKLDSILGLDAWFLDERTRQSQHILKSLPIPSS